MCGGDVYIGYDILKNALELTVKYKMKQNITENIYGVKYTITSWIDLANIFTYTYCAKSSSNWSFCAPSFTWLDFWIYNRIFEDNESSDFIRDYICIYNFGFMLYCYSFIIIIN